MISRPSARFGTATTQGVVGNTASREIVFSVLLLTAAVAALFWPTVQSLLLEWRNTDNLTYTHGYLIAAISCWLLIRAGQVTSAVRPDWRVALALVILSLCWLIALRAGIELLHQLLFPMLALVAVCAALGIRSGARFWFAFAYFCFAIPVWSVGNEILQSVTVVAVRLMLQLTSIPAYVAGNIVHIPAGAFEIAGGCSGLHFFVVALAIAALSGEIHRDSLRARVLLLVLGAVLAMVSNWIRVYTIIVAGHLTDMQHYLVRVDHYYFGWALFAVTMLVYFWLANRVPVQAQPAGSSPSADSDSGERSPSDRRRSLMLGFAIALAAVSVGPALGSISSVARAQTNPGPLLPAVAGLWSGPFETADKWNPSFPGSDRRRLGEYRSNATTASVFVAEYSEQRQGKELVGYDNSIVNGLADSADTPVENQTVRLRGGPGKRLRIGESIIVYYYQIGSERIANPLAAQLRYGLASIIADPASRIVGVHAACVPDCAGAYANAQELLNELDVAWAAPAVSR